MVIQFWDLTTEEREKVFNFVYEYPDCCVREITDSLDGSTFVELLTPENIEQFAKLLTAIIVATFSGIFLPSAI